MRFVIEFLVLYSFVVTCCGSIVIADDPLFGERSITKQIDANLEWLDLTITMGRSLQDIESRLDTEFSGFRLATRVEVRALFDAFELPSDGTYYTLPFADLGPLLDAVGTTFSVGVESRGVFGWVGELSEPGRVFYATAFERFNGPTPFQQIISFPARADGPLPGGPNDHFGSWLVRDISAVPEPTTFIIWAFLGSVSIICYDKLRQQDLSHMHDPCE